jgi:hypothetical protein
MYASGDFLQRVFDGEMAGLQTMHFGFWELLHACFASFARKEDVVLTPEDYCLWLPLLQKCLPLRIEVNVGAGNRKTVQYE